MKEKRKEKIKEKIRYEKINDLIFQRGEKKISNFYLFKALNKGALYWLLKRDLNF